MAEIRPMSICVVKPSPMVQNPSPSFVVFLGPIPNAQVRYVLHAAAWKLLCRQDTWSRAFDDAAY